MTTIGMTSIGYLSFMAKRRTWGPPEQVIIPIETVRLRPGAIEFFGKRWGSSALDVDSTIDLLDPEGQMIRRGGDRSRITASIKEGDSFDLTFTLEMGIAG